MYKVVIGLEVHCELNTNSKVFSSAKNTFSSNPNENVSPVDLGMPGILPVTNEEAVKKALMVAKALNCNLPDEVIFDRKNYFYPDLPKGYQITQVTKPMGKNGYLMIRVKDEIKKVDIHQLHLEEDTASLEHFPKFSLLDYNRSGIPLIEIVTEPCLYSADEAVAFLESLRSIFLYCEVSEADSKKGQMRCDVNISLMKENDSELGTKVEMKNINAIHIVRSAIEYEIKRQTLLLESGKPVLQETRRYSEEDNVTFSMREKVDAVDYKYFIEPNLPPIKLTDKYIKEISDKIPLLQFERIEKYTKDYDLPLYDSILLTKNRKISDYFEVILLNDITPKVASNWVQSIVLGTLNKLEIEIEQFYLTPKMLADVIKLTERKELSLNHAKTILYEAIDNKKDPISIINEKNLKQITDTILLEKLAMESIEENPDILQQYLDGKDYVANFFVGKIMSKTNRQADPVVSFDIIKQELEKRKKNENK